jgi:hypothetical protein
MSSYIRKKLEYGTENKLNSDISIPLFFFGSAAVFLMLVLSLIDVSFLEE